MSKGDTSKVMLIIGVIIFLVILLPKTGFMGSVIDQEISQKYGEKILVIPLEDMKKYDWPNVVAIKLSVEGCSPKSEGAFVPPTFEINSIQTKADISLPSEEELIFGGKQCSDGRDEILIEISKDTLRKSPTLKLTEEGLEITKWSVEYVLQVECIENKHCLKDPIGLRELECDLDTHTCVAVEPIVYGEPEEPITAPLIEVSPYWFLILIGIVGLVLILRYRK